MPISVIHQGSYFGEIGILMNRPSEASFRALTHVELYKLSKADLEDVLYEQPGAAGVGIHCTCSRHPGTPCLTWCLPLVQMLAKIALRRLDWLQEQKSLLAGAAKVIESSMHGGNAYLAMQQQQQQQSREGTQHGAGTRPVLAVGTPGRIAQRSPSIGPSPSLRRPLGNNSGALARRSAAAIGLGATAGSDVTVALIDSILDRLGELESVGRNLAAPPPPRGGYC